MSNNPFASAVTDGLDFIPDAVKTGVLIVFVAVVAVALLKRTVRRLAESSFLTLHTARRLSASLGLLVYGVASLFALQAAGIIVEAWAILSAVFATLAVGFVATWSILSNATAALIVLTFRPFRIGDKIEVYDAEKLLLAGRVVDLNLMFTTVIMDDYATRVPNNFFLQRPVRVSRGGRAPDPKKDLSSTFYDRERQRE